MRKLLALLLCSLTLCGCDENKQTAYDQRPTNQAPTLERPAWPNYDIHNENSFAVFSNVQTAPKKAIGIALEGSGRWTLYRCKDATYLAYDWEVPTYQDWWFFRFNTGDAIIDADTGDEYLLREIEYFPMDQCFWIHGQTGETLRFVLVYPPLPENVRRVQLFETSAPKREWMNGEGWRSRVIDIDELRPHESRPKEGKVIY